MDIRDYLDSVRGDLQVLRILNGAGMLDAASAAEGFASIGRTISDIERLFADAAETRVPIYTLADIAASRAHTVVEGRFTVIEGGRQ